jgi:hypothetical protein
VWTDRAEPPGVIGTHEVCVAVVQAKCGRVMLAPEEVRANADLLRAAPMLAKAATALLAVLDDQAELLADAAIACVPELEALRAELARAAGEQANVSDPE